MAIALLIVDVQNDYFPKGAMELVGSDRALKKIKTMIHHFREKGETIIYIQHIAKKKNPTFFIEGTVGAEIHPEIEPNQNDTVMVKNYPNSFRNTTLDTFCKANEITKLVILGMMTHMCIDTTTRAAFDLGYECVLIGDCCATRDLNYNGTVIHAEHVQKSFLAAINGTFAEVCDCDEYIQRNS